MKVTLINPPVEMNSRRWYPIGIGYIAAVLLERGFQVEIIDCIGENLSRKDFIHRIQQSASRCFGIGGMVTAFVNVVAITNYIRQIHPDAFIFAGNTVAYTIPDILFRSGSINAVVCGEGEITTYELLSAVQEKRDLSTIPGIIFKNPEGEIQTNISREPVRDIDTLPYPAWGLLPIRKYFKNTGHRYCVISTVRGCPYQCIYCCKTFTNYKVRYRSARSIVEELLEFHKRYSISTFYFFDDLTTVNKQRMLEFCELKTKSNLARMNWTISARVNLIDEELIQALKHAKCDDIGFGIESFDQNILNSINKKVDLKQIENALYLCDKYKMNYSGSSFMVGAVCETAETIRKSSQFCKEHNLRYEPHFMTPFPGTPLYEYAIREGLILDERAYLEQLSLQGNTDHLLVNLTKNLNNNDLIRLRNENLFFPKRPRHVTRKILSAMRNPQKLVHLLSYAAGLLKPGSYSNRGSFERYSNIWT